MGTIEKAGAGQAGSGRKKNTLGRAWEGEQLGYFKKVTARANDGVVDNARAK